MFLNILLLVIIVLTVFGFAAVIKTRSLSSTTTTTTYPITTSSPFHGDLFQTYIALNYNSKKGWILRNGSGVGLVSTGTPLSFGFVNGFFYVTSPGINDVNNASYLYIGNNGILYLSTGVPPQNCRFSWNRNGVITHLATGATLELSGVFQLVLSSSSAVLTSGQLFTPEITQVVSTFVDANGNYTDIPGGIYVATDTFNYNQRAWLTASGGASENANACMYSGSPTTFLYQSKKFMLVTSSTTYYLKCIPTSPYNFVLTANTPPDTFTWSQTTGLIIHDQSGLNLEFLIPNAGGSSGNVLLHDATRSNVSNQTQYHPEYTVAPI